MAAKKKADKGSKDYWNRRVLVDKARIINNAEDFLLRNQRDLYGKAEKEIQEEIEKLYRKFADLQKISLAEAKRLIRDADFSKIDWNGMVKQSMELREQIRNGKGNLPDEVIRNLEEQHKKLEDQLKAFAKRGRISYLELKQVEIDRKLLSLYDDQQKNIYDYLRSEYDDGYYRQVFNIQQMQGFGYDFIHPNEAAIDKAILNQYQRQNFSRTLYRHCDNFSKDLRENLVVGMIRGESLDKMASRIKKRMGVAYSAAKTLVRTETAYVYEQATMDAYGQCEIEWYEYLATLDNKTSDVCRGLDGKHFKVKDAMPGKNCPPMHPNCRSTTVCWFPDEKEKKKQTTRLAKDDSGRYYEVPANMTYKQWQEKYGQGTKDASEDLKFTLRILHDNLTDLKNPLKLDQIPHGGEILEVIQAKDSPVARLIQEHYNEIVFINLEPKGTAAFVTNKGIRVDIEKALNDRRGKYVAVYHEIGHNLDAILEYKSRKESFVNTLQEEADSLLKEFVKQYDTPKEAYRDLRNLCRAEPGLYHSFSDLVSGATSGKVQLTYKHSSDYWESDPYNFPSEAFAHFCEAEISGNPEKKHRLEEAFPKSYKMFLEMVSHV